MGCRLVVGVCDSLLSAVCCVLFFVCRLLFGVCRIVCLCCVCCVVVMCLLFIVVRRVLLVVWFRMLFAVCGLLCGVVRRWRTVVNYCGLVVVVVCCL